MNVQAEQVQQTILSGLAVAEDDETLVAVRLMLELELKDRVQYALHPGSTNRDFDAGAAASLMDFKDALEKKFEEARSLRDRRMRPAL